jgi:hypothetical protein
MQKPEQLLSFAEQLTMRSVLNIVGWLVTAIPACLLVATLTLGLRNLDHTERWQFNRFEPQRAGAAEPATGQSDWWIIDASHRRLWINVWCFRQCQQLEVPAQHYRMPISDGEGERFVVLKTSRVRCELGIRCRR